jgi:hypothetical protein
MKASVESAFQHILHLLEAAPANCPLSFVVTVPLLERWGDAIDKIPALKPFVKCTRKLKKSTHRYLRGTQHREGSKRGKRSRLVEATTTTVVYVLQVSVLVDGACCSLHAAYALQRVPSRQNTAPFFCPFLSSNTFFLRSFSFLRTRTVPLSGRYPIRPS